MSDDASQELEALESIFAEDFRKLGHDNFELTIRPGTGSDGVCHVGLRLTIKYLPGYPDTAPNATLDAEKGLNAKQLEAVRGVMAEGIRDNLGTPLVYALAEHLRGWLEEHNEAPGDGSGFEEMMRRQRAAAKAAEKAPAAAYSREDDPSAHVVGDAGRGRGGPAVPATEEEIRAKRIRDGTPVTAETFLAWRTAYEREMEAKRVADEAAGIVDPYAGARHAAGRLTGRQLFESDATLATSDAALAADVDAVSAAAAGRGESAVGGGAGTSIVYTVDAAAYGGASDLLPDDEDDEDYVPPGDDDDDDGDDEDDDDME